MANAVAQLAYAAAIYDWYPGWVMGNDSLFPRRISGTCAHDDEWALGTSEITAWSYAVYWYLLAYGGGLLIWAVNTFTDMEGGIAHQIFYHWNQFLALAPLVTIWHALNIRKSYAENQARYAADLVTFPTNTNACNQKWLFDDVVIDYNAFNFKSNSTTSRILYVFGTAVFSAWVSFYTYYEIEETWLDASEWRLEHMSADSNEGDDTAAATDAAPADTTPTDEFAF